MIILKIYTMLIHLFLFIQSSLAVYVDNPVGFFFSYQENIQEHTRNKNIQTFEKIHITNQINLKISYISYSLRNYSYVAKKKKKIPHNSLKYPFQPHTQHSQDRLQILCDPDQDKVVIKCE